ncbi:MAG: hypothetical protein FJ399_04530 [Verrucomicrobia bacterium]|nr:hypothetical protein [Verrucomicrobiota bacterium]
MTLALGLAVLCLGLASYVVVAEIGKIRDRARRERLMVELKEFATIFENYHNTNRSWPDSTNGEVRVPRGMESVLASTSWSRGSPFGGNYEWLYSKPPAPPPPPTPVPPPGGVPADAAPETLLAPPAPDPSPQVVKPPPPPPDSTPMIVVTAYAPELPLRITAEHLRYIDQKLDDGNLATGRFRVGFNGWPVFRITDE